ncbi:methyl-CpG-binding domain protein 2 [Nematostella vectensis]|uniref:methyl-CpG-binding domain protein 2 n=1 Tax=Nematostella vectensis TaxID=45351 RepID=UPI002076DC4B|nr:methyl-CpG-binding domain protein 2 [Nematostella vectensis]
MEEKPVRVTCPSLPKGWLREIVLRKSGVSAGRSDVYYYSPDGKKCRSKPQLEKELGGVDLTDFDFRSGTFCRRSKRQRSQPNFSRDLNGAIPNSPVRQSTKSFSKQPVSYYPGRQAKKQKVEPINSKIDKEKPKQLFWEKRIQGLTAVNAEDERKLDAFNLGKTFRVIGPGMDEKALVHALVTNIHTKSSIKGQSMSLVALEKHPEIWINVDQPPCAPFVITDADIKAQEERVSRQRQKLAEAIAEHKQLKYKSLFITARS